jgi:hypothetical protein
VLGTGNPCSGALAVTTGVFLPHGTQFAVSQTDKIRCFYNPGSGWIEATNDPAMDCIQNPAHQLSDGSWDLGTRAVGHFWQVEIMFPLKSTQELKGAAGANGGDRLVGHVESSIVAPLVVQPSAFVWVPGSTATTTPSVSYPNPSATNVTDTTARTTGYVYNHFNSGNAYFDLGTSTAYGVTAGPAAIPNTGDAFSAFADWSNLSAGTTYHWRMRFVTSTGQTFVGPDQTFKTTGGSDTTPPAVKAPVASLQAGSQLGTKNVPVKISWSATDDSGILGYDLKKTQFFGNGTASQSTEFLQTNVATAQLAPGPDSYQFAVTGYDNANNSSGAVAGPKFGVRASQESSSAISYSGTWRTQSLSSAYGGKVKYSSAKGSGARLTFTGRSVAWVAPQGNNRGKAAVYIGGTKAATVDLYSANARTRQIVFRKAWSSSGRHKIEVRALGTKNAASSAKRVDLDAFVVLR